MEIKRLYNKEKKFLLLKALAIFVMVTAASIFIFTKSNTTFKDYLIKLDIERLYEYIEKPDFSYDVFHAYMVYNYSGKLEIVNTIKDKNSIRYTVKGNNGEKNISLVKKKGRYFWIFDDYAYNWRVKLLKNAIVKIEKTLIKNIDGIAVVEKIPFGLYDICIESNVSDTYKAKILAGQNVEIKLKPSYLTVKKCEESIMKFLRFKESALKNKKIEAENSIVKESGVYREVVDEVEWQKANRYNILKELKSSDIKESIMDASGLVYVNVEESWEVTVNNDGRTEKKLEACNNTYIINPDLKFIIEGIKTN